MSIQSIESYLMIGASLVISLIIALLITPGVIKLANKLGIVDTPSDDRRMHDHPIPLLGGISIVVAFIITSIIMAILMILFQKNTQMFSKLFQILPGALIIAVMGFLDDKYNLPALPRLFIQCVAAGITVALGVRITLISGSIRFLHAPTFTLGLLLSIPITIIWIVGITNAVNWIDGLDGLAVGVSSIASASMLLIAVIEPNNKNTAVAILAAAVTGGCLGLLPFNKHPAKVFMGDTGAMFLGFTLSVISIQGLLKIYASISFALPLLIFGLPLFDTASAIIRRVCSGKSPAAPDRSHIHHKLVDMGLSQKQAVFLLYSVSSVLAIVAILFSVYYTTVGWRFLIVGLVIIVVILIALNFILKRWNQRAAITAAACRDDSIPDKLKDNAGNIPNSEESKK